VMRDAAAEAGRDPDAITLSVVGYPIIGEDRADYRERLGAMAAGAGKEPAEYEAILEARHAIKGTVDEAKVRLEELKAAGVGRYYIQVYAALAEIDTDDVGRAFSLLRD